MHGPELAVETTVGFGEAAGQAAKNGRGHIVGMTFQMTGLMQHLLGVDAAIGEQLAQHNAQHSGYR